MENFEYRRDRFETFARFDNPLINLSMRWELPDFRPYCKAQQLPPFHFLLYCLLTTIPTIDNFMYRIHEGEVIKIDKFHGSYTVYNDDGNLNFALFDISPDLHEFIARSVAAGKIAKSTRAMIDTHGGKTGRDRLNNIFITSLPWFELTAIEHPITSHKAADIPSFAWGKFSEPAGDTMVLPMSVQAHHGFVDGYHVHQLAQALRATIRVLIS